MVQVPYEDTARRLRNVLRQAFRTSAPSSKASIAPGDAALIYSLYGWHHLRGELDYRRPGGQLSGRRHDWDRSAGHDRRTDYFSTVCRRMRRHDVVSGRRSLRRFSDTKVIAGGKCVPFTLVAPRDHAGEHSLRTGRCGSPIRTRSRVSVVHAATPYRVTSIFRIPIIPPSRQTEQVRQGAVRIFGLDGIRLPSRAKCAIGRSGSSFVAPQAVDFKVQSFQLFRCPTDTITQPTRCDPTLRPQCACLQFPARASPGDRPDASCSGRFSNCTGYVRSAGKLQVEFQLGDGTVPGDLIAEVIKKNLTAGTAATSLQVDTYVNYDQPSGKGLPAIKSARP